MQQFDTDTRFGFTLAMDFSQKHFDAAQSVLQPKLDGVRVGIIGWHGAATAVDKRLGRTVSTRTLTRSGSYVPNDYIRSLLDRLPAGLDGELVLRDAGRACGEAPFSDTMSAVSSKSGEPDFAYVVYDFAPFDWAEQPYSARLAEAELLVQQLPSNIAKHVCIVPSKPAKQLEQQVAELVALGYEGGIVRRTDLPHRAQRCNGKYPAVMRIKQQASCEARIVRVVSEVWHDCAANRKHRPQLIGQPKDFASSFECEGLPGTPFAGQTFRVPLAVPDSVARQYLQRADELVGQLCSVRYLAAGNVAKPRQPVCAGLRFDFDTDTQEAA